MSPGGSETSFNSLSRDHLRLFRLPQPERRVKFLSTPSLGITELVLTGNSFLRPIGSFQLPLSGSRVPARSSGIGRAGGTRGSFNSLSRDHMLVRKSALDAIQILYLTFNSLSRDHAGLTVIKFLRGLDFQLPLSGSHEIIRMALRDLFRKDFQLPLSGSHVRAVGELFGTASDVTFNSLSRDHFFLRASRC